MRIVFVIHASVSNPAKRHRMRPYVSRSAAVRIHLRKQPSATSICNLMAARARHPMRTPPQRPRMPNASTHCPAKVHAAGHGGASGRYDRWRDTAFEMAWMLGQVGVTK
jgi:hypothetical protein